MTIINIIKTVAWENPGIISHPEKISINLLSS